MSDEAHSEWFCSRCDRLFALKTLGGAVTRERCFAGSGPDAQPTLALWLESGVLLLGAKMLLHAAQTEADRDFASHALYCPACAQSVAICRVCGCTDEAACEDGCWWVEADLCSSCEKENGNAND